MFRFYQQRASRLLNSRSYFTKAIICQGKGRVRAKTGDRMGVKYIGRLKETGAVFEDSGSRRPFHFQLGIGQVVKGWDAALRDVKVGDKTILTVQPAYGYGAEGLPGKVPPNAVLQYEIDILTIEKDNPLHYWKHAPIQLPSGPQDQKPYRINKIKKRLLHDHQIENLPEEVDTIASWKWNEKKKRKTLQDNIDDALEKIKAGPDY